MLIIAVWCAVFLIRLMPVGGSWLELDKFTWTIFILWAIIYFGSILLGLSRVSEKTYISIQPSSKWLNYWVRRLCLFSSVGAFLIIFEFAITRGYGFSTPVAVVRMMEVDAASSGFEGSWLSGIGRMLTPALMVAWILAVLEWSVLRKRTLVILCISSAVILYQQIMFEGGRFYLAAILVMIFLVRSFVSQYKSNEPRVAGKKLLWIILFVVICLIFGYMFVDRYQQSNQIFSVAYEAWAANFDLELNDEVILRLSGKMAAVWLAVCMLWAYVTQGINELNSLLVSSPPDLAWGTMQFPQIAQALNKLSGLQFRYDELGNLPKSGTYITLYGASYIDFGYFGAYIFVGFIGWFTGRAIRQLNAHHLNALSLTAPILVTLGIFSPIVSLVVNLWPAFCWALLVGGSLKFYSRKIDKKKMLA